MPEQAFTLAAIPRASSPNRAANPSAARALKLAALCLMALVLVYLVAELVPAARVRDAVALHDFTLLGGTHVAPLARFSLKLLDPLLFTIWAIALVLFALARARPRVAVAVAVVLAAAPLSADRLKPLLAHPHARVDGIHLGAASWPSGHAAAALALALCAVLVTPTRWRGLVAALGAVFTVAIGCSMLVLAWHMPSDLLGGYLVAALWMALAVAGLRAAERRWPSSPAPLAPSASAG